MSRRAVVVLVVISVVLLTLYVAGRFVMDPNAIDDLNWKGDPVPPCFVNAALCGGHILGTDEVGRDLLARLVVGARMTLGVSLAGALAALAIGIILSVVCRLAGPIARFAVARFADAASAIPAWPILILILAGVDSHRWWTIAILAGALFWPGCWRLLVAGTPADLVLRRVARDWAMLILTLTVVDLFGYGTWPPTASWGTLLVSMEATMATGWWIVACPALCIFVAVVALRAIARYALSSTSGATDASGSPTSG